MKKDKTYGGFLGYKIAHVKKVNTFKKIFMAFALFLSVGTFLSSDASTAVGNVITASTSLAVILPTSAGNGGGGSNGGGNVNVVVNTGDIPYIDMSGDPPINPMQNPDTVPTTMTQTVASATGGGAANITSYFFNEDVFNATATNNGSGASSVVITYSDGWSGNGYNNLGKSVNGGNGILAYGFTLEIITTSGGAQNGTALNASNPTYLTSSLVGSTQRPNPMPLNSGTRNNQYQLGTMTVKKNMYFSSVNQFSHLTTVGCTDSLIILCRPFM